MYTLPHKLKYTKQPFEPNPNTGWSSARCLCQPTQKQCSPLPTCSDHTILNYTCRALLHEAPSIGLWSPSLCGGTCQRSGQQGVASQCISIGGASPHSPVTSLETFFNVWVDHLNSASFMKNTCDFRVLFFPDMKLQHFRG